MPASKLRKGFTCRCGKSERFSPCVYAHWQDELTFTCACGAKYDLRAGVVTDMNGKEVKSQFFEGRDDA